MPRTRKEELLAQIAEHERKLEAGESPVPVESPSSEPEATAEPESSEVAPEPELEPEVTTPESEATSVDPVAEDPKERKKIEDFYAKTDALEKRFKEQIDAVTQQTRADLAARDQVIAELREQLGKNGQTTPTTETEVDPETAAWNAAFKESADEFINPQISQFQQALAAIELNNSIRFAAITRPDYYEVVNLGDPDHFLTKHLRAHPEIQARIRDSGNPGKALYDEGIFQRESTQEAREKWREQERIKIEKEADAKYQKQLQAALKKVQVTGIKPDSIITGGTPVTSEAVLTEEALSKLPAVEKRKILARLESGQMRVENGVLVDA